MKLKPLPLNYTEYDKGYSRVGQSRKISLVFPQSYEIGIASIGFQTVCRVFHENNFEVTRYFMGNDYIYTDNTSNNPLTDDIIGFSLFYEWNYFSISPFLNTFHIPLKNMDRNEKFPLIIAGGACISSNPLPVASFFDILCLGECENWIPQLSEKLPDSKNNIFHELNPKDGFCVPHMGFSEKKRIEFPEFVNTGNYTDILSPYSEFSEMLVFEISRGCPGKCKYCMAGHISGSFRYISLEVFKELYRKTLSISRRNIGLAGLSISFHPQLMEILDFLSLNKEEISLSSVKADSLNRQFLEIISKNTKTLTLAPETGCPEMLKRIGKNISLEKFMDKLPLIEEFPLQNLKLYLMFGFPDETLEDIEKTCSMIKMIHKAIGKKVKLHLSINQFLPKPHTPFESFPLDDPKQIQLKKKFLEKSLSSICRLSVHSGTLPQITTILSKGDVSLFDCLSQSNIPIPSPAEVKSLFRDHSISMKSCYQTTKNLPWKFIN